jgi:hypothetical protein
LRLRGKNKMGKKRQDLTAKNTNGANKDVAVKADGMLWSIQAHGDEVEMIQRVIEAEIGRIREKYANVLAEKTAKRTNAEKALKKFALKNKEDLFGKDGDKVSLSHGIILYAKEDKVTIPKDAVEQIEKLGWDEGIVIVKNIDRPVIEKWNDEKLAAIGASKKPKETISWELKAQSSKAVAV